VALVVRGEDAGRRGSGVGAEIELVDEGEGGFVAVDFGDGDRAVEGGDGRGVGGEELVVESDDQGPVGVVIVWG
jgi:hypothetical protein